MNDSKSNFKFWFIPLVVGVITIILNIILTFVFNLDFILFIILLVTIIIIILSIFLIQLVYKKLKTMSEIKKRKKIMDLDWKGLQPREREKFMEWMDD
jgi:hypothetical protein